MYIVDNSEKHRGSHTRVPLLCTAVNSYAATRNEGI